MKKRFNNTPDPMPDLGANEVFVFGANELGLHLSGSAKAASLYYGAVMGEIHRTGRGYGLVTIYFEKPKITIEELKNEFSLFIKQIELETEKNFYLTKVGTGVAGWKLSDLKDCLHEFYIPSKHLNLVIPLEFELTEN